MTFVPIVSFESPDKWYAEARYNYEELETVSFYVGKAFTGRISILSDIREPHGSKDKLSYSVTPLLGGVAGKYKGVSGGMNAVVEYRHIFFSTQSQYTIAYYESGDFFFAWSELGYQPWSWLFVGVTTQHTYLYQSANLMVEPGGVIGFTIGQWNFPLYVFSPASDHHYFVIGASLSIGGLTGSNR